MRNVNQIEMTGKRQQQSGFSLIELLIVVAIILIIAAIAIPNFMRSKMAANEASAAENIRTITTAAVAYSASWSNGYPPTLATLGGVGAGATCNAANLIDPILANAPNQKSGYTFAWTGQGAPVVVAAGCTAPGYNSYLVTATPITLGVSGQRSFCATEPAVIHYDVTGNTAASEAACEALPTL